METNSASLTDTNLHEFCKNLNLKLRISSLIRDDLQTMFLLLHMLSWDYGAEFRSSLEKSKEPAAYADQVCSTVREGLLQQHDELGKGS